MQELTPQQIENLVDKFLGCPAFASLSGRERLLEILPDRISHNIPAGGRLTPRQAAFEIVTACLAFEGGLAELASAVKVLEKGTANFEAVQAFLEALGVNASLELRFNERLPARNLKFIGREAELTQLHAHLAKGNTVALTALHGMGGVGKTSLALEYLYRHQAEYAFTFWLPSENALTLELEFIALAELLGLGKMPTDTKENRVASVQKVRSKLDNYGKDWLLVFDNAQKPEDITPYRPGGAGHVIVTSRNRQWGQLSNAIEVNVLTEQEALMLLAAYCYPDKTQSELVDSVQGWLSGVSEAKKLVKELGYLALAITQAGAYIQATNKSIAGYLSLFEQYKLKLFGTGAAKLLDYKETVATTWQVSFEAIEQENPAAADLLNMLAFFAPDGIKLSWFSSLSNNTQATVNLPARLASMLENELALEEGLAILLKYSLLTREIQEHGKAEQMALHRLVQLVIREKLANEKLDITESRERNSPSEAETSQIQITGAIYWLNQAICFLRVLFPDESQYFNLPECDEMIDHIQSVLGHYKPIQQKEMKNGEINHEINGLNLLQVGILFSRAASYFFERGFYSEAKPHYEQAIVILEKALDSDHYDLAACLSNLASLLRNAGDYAGTKLLLERAIIIIEKTRGKEHPDFAACLTSMGLTLSATGDYKGASECHERAIAITEKALGKNHPKVATSHNNLAEVLQATGNYAEAKRLYEQAIAVGEETLEEDNPTLASWLNNLASLHSVTKDYAEAKRLYKRAIAIAKKTLSSNHPTLAIYLNNHAQLLHITEDYAEAKRLYEQAITITEMALGSDHPDLAKWLNNLAKLRHVTGERIEAIQMLKKALSIFQAKLGDSHELTKRTIQTLIQWEKEV